MLINKFWSQDHLSMCVFGWGCRQPCSLLFSDGDFVCVSVVHVISIMFIIQLSTTVCNALVKTEHFITRKVYPSKPQLYIVKLMFAGVYIFFFIFYPEHRLCVLVRTVMYVLDWRYITIEKPTRS